MSSLRWLSALIVSFSVACGGKSAPDTTPSEPEPSSEPASEPASEPEAGILTPEQCTEQGGELRGDIGDGKVACAEGERELGRVRLGIEGSVCCAPAAP
jgi:hypothetical protein